MRKAKFMIQGAGVFEGYHRGKFWNGWDVPVFTKAQAMEMVEVGFLARPEEGYEGLTYDADKDEFRHLIPDHDAPWMNGIEPWETYSGRTVDGLDEPVYEIGDGFVWEEVIE